jgi:hypothetical protein
MRIDKCIDGVPGLLNHELQIKSLHLLFFLIAFSKMNPLQFFNRIIFHLAKKSSNANKISFTIHGFGIISKYNRGPK